MEKLSCITFIIPKNLHMSRLDIALTHLMPNISRNKLSTWIKNNFILLNNKTCKPKEKVFENDIISVYPQPDDTQLQNQPEAIKLDIVYKDEHILVINKPPHLTVHPGHGNLHGTLLNGLLYSYPELKNLVRAGIVHRLDKDTSGLMIIARTEIAQLKLIKDLEERKITRIYRAVVEGHTANSGTINKNIGRDPKNRIKMTTLDFGGKTAITHYKTLQHFTQFSYIECKLETGRTHQIRVHLKSLNHPIVGDQTYNKNKKTFPQNIYNAIHLLHRQALHAIQLTFYHPITNIYLNFKISLAADIKLLLNELQKNEDNINSITKNFESDPNWDFFYKD